MEEKYNVRKSSGRMAKLDISKIEKFVKEATKDLNNVSTESIISESGLIFYDGIPTKDISRALIKTAVSKIDVDAPDYQYVAARMHLFGLYHQVGKTLKTKKGNAYPEIESYLDYGIKAGKIIPELKRLYNLEKINKAINPERDMQFNYLGIKTLNDRYLNSDSDNKVFELPQHLFMAVAMFVAQKEVNVLPEGSRKIPHNLNIEKHQEYVRTEWAIRFYNMLSLFEVMAATPTLSNARTPRSQLSSCFVGAVPDNIEGIFDMYKEYALLSKFGGGIGSDWSSVRGMSSPIDGNVGASGGPVPFLKITNDVAIAVDQLGVRLGSIAVYEEPWHIDILEFLELKKTSGEERRRAHDLFPSVFLNDLFLERVNANEDWTLFSPYDVPGLKEAYGDDFFKLYRKYELDESIPKKTINAKKLWKVILKEYFETGTPFLSFKDTANRANQNKHAGVIRSSNLCQEIFQNTSPNEYKILIELNSGKLLTYDEQEVVRCDSGIEKKAKSITITDSINGEEIFFIGKETIDGETAVCNLASINLSKVNTKKKLEEIIPVAVRFLDAVIDLNYYPVRKAKVTNLKSRAIGLGMMGEAQMLAENGIHYASQEHFEEIDSIMEIISFNTIKASMNLAKEKGSYPSFDGSGWSKGIMPHDYAPDVTNALTSGNKVYSNEEWDGLRNDCKSHMRNGYLMAVAPTSSISILVGTTQANEPIFKRHWIEENLSGNIPVCAPKLSPKTWEYYVNAYEVLQLGIIKAGAIRQKWIDQGQSLNIFLTQEAASGKALNEIYMNAWKYGLKSTYYLRSKSAEVLHEVEVEDRSQECFGCQ
ncbi:MAG TPA: ribonucleoside-diphosphate reductase subunit alpha [Bacteroidia bacterium]|nr:ribonucleoside-diphosphate reductase subunit alpha [Bacteroidia bacterium]